jgi:hypothetical protein
VLTHWLTVTLDDANMAYTVQQQQQQVGADAAAAAAAARAAWVSEGAAAAAGRAGCYFLRTKGVIPIASAGPRYYLQAVREKFDLAPAAQHAAIDRERHFAAAAESAGTAAESADKAAGSGDDGDSWEAGQEREARIAVIGLGLDAAFICDGLNGCVTGEATATQ